MLHHHSSWVWLLGLFVMGTFGTQGAPAITSTASLADPSATTIGIATGTLTWTEEEVITYVGGAPFTYTLGIYGSVTTTMPYPGVPLNTSTTAGSFHVSITTSETKSRSGSNLTSTTQ
ncbi:hypothetical protein PG997_001754 [Apiospora hydei]|uniref:Uncharacterized protein n=1 Tax=Apiospora hydei TaxID=1337664 RepID=A0ABR1XEK7_9PEZI